MSLFCLLTTLATHLAQGAASPVVDLSKAIVVVPEASAHPLLAKAADWLCDEIKQRCGIRLERRPVIAKDRPCIVIEIVSSSTEIEVPDTPEGFAITIDSGEASRPVVHIVGRDDRGALFGVGRLLRNLHMDGNSLGVDAELRAATAPKYPIRGHQLGYWEVQNTYDAWDLAMYEQYIRDLIAFGANSIEICAWLDPKAGTKSPLMRETPWDMNLKLAELIHGYGLDVWVFLPLTEGDVSNPEIAERELARRKKFFGACPHIDALFVPGGDPGDTPPQVLMPWLERLSGVLRESHPHAQLWVSNQGFDHAANDWFFTYLGKQRPAWLSGVVYGPWTKMTLPEMRKRTPAQYPFRDYPDITHCVRCQYPVPSWDRAFAHTLGREPINPRPRAMAHIHNLFAEDTSGFIAYSEGVNDDVNKFVWLAQSWDPGAPLEMTLREFARYFIDEPHSDKLAKAIAALEDNWEGPLKDNASIEQTLGLWLALERDLPIRARNNWRFQQGIFRAYYDAYIRERLIHEYELEARAIKVLAESGPDGIETARQILAEQTTSPPKPEWNRRIRQLGDALFGNIGMQLSVARHKAHGPERGAVLDFLEHPLNNRPWLEAQFAEILAMNKSEARRECIARIVSREDPGPGGFYDDLGNAMRQPHLVSEKTWLQDPGYVESPQDEFLFNQPTLRLSQQDQAQTLYGTPLKMLYDGLDSNAAYTLRVVYSGRFKATMRLVANGTTEIHPALPQPASPAPVEFPIPREATRTGTLNLEWQLVEGRGCQVAEVWLIRS